MALRMPRPINRRDSRNAQFSQRIPADLAAIAPGTVVTFSLSPGQDGLPPVLVQARCGKTHIRVSLGTGAPKLAKERHAQALAAVAEHWRRLREGQQELPLVELSARQCAELAGEVYRTWQEATAQDPLFPAETWTRVADEFDAIAAGQGPRARLLIPSIRSPEYGEAIYQDMSDRTEHHVAAVLAAARLNITPNSRRLLTRRTFEALKFSARQSARMAEGDFRPDPDAERFPAPDKPLFRAPAKSFTKVFDEYALVPGKFGQRKPDTIDRYRTIFVDEFGAFAERSLKQADPLLVSRKDVAEWRNELFGRGLSQKTVSDVKLAAVRAVYARQVHDGFMEINPADIGIVRGRKTEERLKGFSDAEAEAILMAGRAFMPGRHSAALTNAIRWVPLLAAASGARIAELCQARRQDFDRGTDGWSLRITPEAGGVKNASFRVVPLHSGLLALGLGEFLDEAGDGPVFYKPRVAGAVSLEAARTTGQRIAEWVRKDVGIRDQRVSPNHGWRHRFATLCRRAGVHPEYRKAIGGWGKSDQAAHYGDMAGLRREIERISAADMFPGLWQVEGPNSDS